LRRRRPRADRPLHLVLVRDLLTGELAGDRLETDELRLEPGVVVELVDQRRCGLRQVGRVPGLLSIDPLLDVGGPVVGVDQAVHMPPQAQAKLEVALGH
jgi:hypothetical protein